jgi:hypothetical protein
MTSEPLMVELRGFTGHTLAWLVSRNTRYAPQRIYGERYALTGAHAMAMLAELKDTAADGFPGGKWATIQHLEALIAQTIDKPN